MWCVIERKKEMVCEREKGRERKRERNRERQGDNEVEKGLWTRGVSE